MPFPEFDRDKRKVLFFSRGRGRGHAIPDIEIVRQLERLRNDVQVRFVSYGTGARTIEEFRLPLIDMGLPELNSYVDTTVLAGKLIAWLAPDLVVSHEEFAALPAAKIFDKPTVLITDWFTDPEKYSMQSLRFADRIIFIDKRGIYAEPPWVKGKVRYVGPVLRKFEYRRRDRARARRELGITKDATVISVLPGSWTEEMVPIYDVVIAAFDKLRASPKHLIWLAGADHELLAAKTAGRGDVTVIERDWQIDRLMVASNLAITKANRKTVVELEYLGIPSISLSPNQNPIDDNRALRSKIGQVIPFSEASGQKVLGKIRRCLDLEAANPRAQRRMGHISAAREIAHTLPAG